jgi:hypothetical protein
MSDEDGAGLRKLGELLIAEGAITEDQLAEAMAEQDGSGMRLGEILLARRTVSRLDLANAFAEQFADARRPSPTQPDASVPAGDGVEPHVGREIAAKVAEMDALLTRVAREAEELSRRLAALEARLPAIGGAPEARAS